jgi:hypothetical protein
MRCDRHKRLMLASVGAGERVDRAAPPASVAEAVVLLML